MTEEDRILKLKTEPLKIPLVGVDRFWQVVQRVCAMISVLALAVAAVGIVLVFNLAICTNTNLGKRSAPSQKDALAHIAYAQAQASFAHAQNTTSAALFTLLKAPVAEQAHDYELFLTAFANSQMVARRTQAATDAYTTQLTADQAARNAHPLGKC